MEALILLAVAAIFWVSLVFDVWLWRLPGVIIVLAGLMLVIIGNALMGLKVSVDLESFCE